MAAWIDVFSLIATITILSGVVWGIVYIVRIISSAKESTKKHLRTKGVDVSEHGMSVKTNRRYDRERYLDDTQRRLVQAYNSSTFGKPELDAETPRASESNSGGERKRTTSSIKARRG